jgi:D-arabinose 1-dehydrogenase-like Zn-dependent alcohol dehydrogenase
MTKYELVKVTNPDNSIVYFIRKNGGSSIAGSFTTKLNEAEEMLKEFEKGKPSEPIMETIKTIEVKEGAND